MAKILVVDDEQKVRHLLTMILENSGHEIENAEDGFQAFAMVQEKHFDILITDIKMPGLDGVELIKKVKKAQIPCPVIVITAFATVSSAVETMRAGASDYITKPFETDQILLAVERTLNISRLLTENQILKDEIEKRDKRIIYESPVMDNVLKLAKSVALRDSVVLIQGESGTGKELLARYIHNSSERRAHRFVPINCAAISAGLVESELFGHEKGAFTGADKKVQGKFEFAAKGTIFLDEIGDLPFETQAKLLRVLQEKKITRVGGNHEIATDARVVCATNRNLTSLVKEDKFREDLYYRINVFPLISPPLRDRREDIIPLVLFFITQKSHGRSYTLAESARKKLLSYGWPGNVRELANAVERAIILAGETSRLTASTFSFIEPDTGIQKKDRGFVLPDEHIDLEAVICSFAEQALDAAEGNQSAAARRLGVTRSKFRVLMKQAGIENGTG